MLDGRGVTCTLYGRMTAGVPLPLPEFNSVDCLSRCAGRVTYSACLNRPPTHRPLRPPLTTWRRACAGSRGMTRMEASIMMSRSCSLTGVQHLTAFCILGGIMHPAVFLVCFPCYPSLIGSKNCDSAGLRPFCSLVNWTCRVCCVTTCAIIAVPAH